MIIAGVALICAPFLGTPRAPYRDIVKYDAVKTPQGLSWQYSLLRVMSVPQARHISYALLAVFVLVAFALSGIADIEFYVAATLVTFPLCSKVVLEQYLLWPMPWLILLLWGRSRRLMVYSLILLTAMTFAGTIDAALPGTDHPCSSSPRPRHRQLRHA
jgi:hypothetical protein